MKIAPKIKKRRGEGKEEEERRQAEEEERRQGGGERREAEEEERRQEEWERRWAEEEEEVVRSIFNYSLSSEEDFLPSEEEGRQSEEYVPEKGALDSLKWRNEKVCV